MINAMFYKGYTTNMVFDAEDKVIVGRILDVDDIISFHGESVAEFESNFHAANEGYLAASKELGSAPEKPASGIGSCIGRVAHPRHSCLAEGLHRLRRAPVREWVDRVSCKRSNTAGRSGHRR